MLSFLLKLMFIVLAARFLAGLLRLFRPKRREGPQGRRREAGQVPSHLGEDIVDADFEDVEKKP
jgi:hypothetical protein